MTIALLITISIYINSRTQRIIIVRNQELTGLNIYTGSIKTVNNLLDTE